MTTPRAGEMKEYLLVVLGWLLGTITPVVGVLWKWLSDWRSRPILNAAFDKDGGSIIDTPFYYPGSAVSHHSARYFRVKIENAGRTPARRCRAYLVAVQQWSDAGARPNRLFDPLPLPWSYRTGEDAYEPFDVPSGCAWFVDVVLSAQEYETQPRYQMTTHLLPSRYNDLLKESKPYLLTVNVLSENAPARVVRFIVEFHAH
jgi:hypothetical protein